jgi:hypothetical protein
MCHVELSPQDFQLLFTKFWRFLGILVVNVTKSGASKIHNAVRRVAKSQDEGCRLSICLILNAKSKGYIWQSCMDFTDMLKGSCT